MLCGDGRCDSLGKCAEFCTYSLIESESNVILHFENVDKRNFTIPNHGKRRDDTESRFFDREKIVCCGANN